MTAAHRIEPEHTSDKTSESVETPEKAPETGRALVPGPRGGMLWRGGPPPGRAVAGPGRPRDELRAKLVELGRSKAVPFLEEVLDGKVTVTLVGTCAHCSKETPMDLDRLTEIAGAIGKSVDTRIKASEQALKYGVGTQKEVSVANVRERMERTLETIQRICPPDVAKQLIEAIRPVWS